MAPLASSNISTGLCKVQNGPGTHPTQVQALVHTNGAAQAGGQASSPDFYTKYKPGSDAVLALLGQVDAALNAMQLMEDNPTTLYSELEKHCEAVDLAAQHQLYSLDIALQTYKLISACYNYLDKALGPSAADQAGALLNNLQFS
ncbi:hypothetical protein C0995_016179 [Termitomyces sp. Mi166|nr:hypothetical protein C0995_016179 [Termitomyces sp. Mi166\